MVHESRQDTVEGVVEEDDLAPGAEKANFDFL